jgi:hypothetical protein
VTFPAQKLNLQTEVGVSSEIGLSALLIVEEEDKPDLEPVLILLLLTGELSVKELKEKSRIATLTSALVYIIQY